MTPFETPHRSQAAAALGKRLRAGIARLAAARRARRTLPSLHRLSDWELKDIGLTRWDICHAARITKENRS